MAKGLADPLLAAAVVKKPPAASSPSLTSRGAEDFLDYIDSHRTSSSPPPPQQVPRAGESSGDSTGTSSPSAVLGSNALSSARGGRQAFRAPRVTSSGPVQENDEGALDGARGRASSTGTMPPSSSATTGVWWDCYGMLRRRSPPQLPVSAPGRCSCFAGFGKLIEAPLDRLDAEKVVAMFGFSLFGSISLLPSTAASIKGFTESYQRFILLSFGFVWVLTSVGVLCGLHGRTDFEHRICRLTGRLGILGLALLVVLHIGWMLPQDQCSTIAFYILLGVALGVHVGSWIMSRIHVEDRNKGATD